MFVGVPRDACVCLMSVSGDECVYVCLWMFAHVVCGCGLVCVPRAPWVYVPFGHPVSCPCLYLLVYACASLPSGVQSTCDCVHVMCRVAIRQMRFTSATGPFVSEQIVLPMCLSPGLYIRSHRAHLKVGGGVSCTKRWGKGGGLEARMLGHDWSKASLRGEGAAGRGWPSTCLPSMALRLQLRSVELGSAQLSQGEVSALPVVSGHCPWSVLPAARLPLPFTHCVTLGTSPPLSWPLYILQMGLVT